MQPFLESGWWAVGPYPLGLDLTCPPEIDPDPSKPVATADGTHKLKWQTVPYTPASGTIAIETAMGSQKNVSFYALAYVYADRDRTASFNLEAGDEPFRLWVNQKLAFEGYACWKGGIDREVQIPIALHAGRNTLLIEARADERVLVQRAASRRPDSEGNGSATPGPLVRGGRRTCRCGPDHPSQRRNVPVPSPRALRRAGTTRLNVRLERWFAASTAPAASGWYRRYPSRACCPRSRPRTVICGLRPWSSGWNSISSGPSSCWATLSIEVAVSPPPRSTSASRCESRTRPVSHHCWPRSCTSSGRSDESRKVLQEAEERHSSLVKQGLASPPYRPAPNWEAELYSQLTLKEARRLILGKDSGPSEDEKALMGKARELRNALEAADDHFTRLAMKYPRRRGCGSSRDAGWVSWAGGTRPPGHSPGLPRWHHNDPQVWKARGRAYAELGKRAEAAADFAQMLNSLQTPPVPEEHISYYKWILSRHGIDDTMVRDPDLYERLTAIRPTDATLVNARVQYLIRHGRYGEAATVQERFVQLATITLSLASIWPCSAFGAALIRRIAFWPGNSSTSGARPPRHFEHNT